MVPQHHRPRLRGHVRPEVGHLEAGPPQQEGECRDAQLVPDAAGEADRHLRTAALRAGGVEGGSEPALHGSAHEVLAGHVHAAGPPVLAQDPQGGQQPPVDGLLRAGDGERLVEGRLGHPRVQGRGGPRQG